VGMPGITYSTYTHRGLTFFLAWYDKSFIPGSFLWGHWHYRKTTSGKVVPTRFEILGCFTEPTWRCQGIMTGLIGQVFDTKTCECVYTDDGSKNGGKQLIKAMGFQRCSATKIWYLQRPKKGK